MPLRNVLFSDIFVPKVDTNFEWFLILKIFELDFVNFDSDNDKNPKKIIKFSKDFPIFTLNKSHKD